jgi:outer membrane protein assembly factor BamB
VRKRTATIVAAVLLCGTSTLTISLSAADWPQWRGPANSGASTETSLPLTWSNTENIAWKVQLAGVGVSSPIVSGDRLFVTSQLGAGASRTGPRLGQGADAATGERSLAGGATGQSGAVRFVVEALNAIDGRRLWTYELPAQGPLPEVHDKHNLASASPIADGERVYAVFGTGQVSAIDMSGKAVWTRHLGQDFAPFVINWGNGSSPALYRDSLILQCYHENASYLIALDTRTGKQLWKTDRPRGVLSYSTPLVVPTPQGDELVVNSSVGIEAYNPANGAPLWHFNETNQFPIPVAMHADGMIYLSRGYRSGPYAAIRPGGRGDISKTHIAWHVPTGAPYISSLVHYQGLLYMAGDVGVVTCVDAKTGERVWRERIDGVFTASPVAGDGKIYMLSETGDTVVLKAGRQPEVLSRNAIDGRILASPAISGGRLFIRTDNAVVAIGRGRV